MSLSDEEADKLWLEMFEKEKVKRGLLFATELYQPVHIRCRLNEAKQEFPHITQLKYQSWFNTYGVLAAESILNDDRTLWFKRWFGSADK